MVVLHVERVVHNLLREKAEAMARFHHLEHRLLCSPLRLKVAAQMQQVLHQHVAHHVQRGPQVVQLLKGVALLVYRPLPVFEPLNEARCRALDLGKGGRMAVGDEITVGMEWAGGGAGCCARGEGKTYLGCFRALVVFAGKTRGQQRSGQQVEDRAAPCETRGHGAAYHEAHRSTSKCTHSCMASSVFAL